MKNILITVLSILAATCLFTGKSAQAAQYDIKEMTPQVMIALDSRRARYDKLGELKAKGVLGENNRGYVQVLKDDENAAAVAARENVDRKIIYHTIAEQNNLSGAILTIEKVFASVQREKASPGEMIQTEDGSWVTK